MDLKSYIRVVPDFPVQGISFKDITTLLKDGKAFQNAVERLVEMLSGLDCDLIAAPEARGFIIAAPVAARLGIGFVPIRKPGKLPGTIIRHEYDLEYGKDVLEMHEDAIPAGAKVVILDDLLATAGTSKAICELIEKAGGKVSALCFLAELDFLNGREVLKDYEVFSIVHYEE